MNVPVQGGTFRRDKIANVILVIACQSFQALGIGAIALFLPLIRTDLHLTFSQGGIISAAGALTYTLMQLPAGYLGDRFGAKRLFIVGAIGTTVFALIFGLVTQYWQAVVNQTFSGAFRALLFAPGLALITAWFPPERRATATGLFMVSGLSGNLVVDIIGPLLVRFFDWRFPFIVFASIGIIITLVFWRLGKESPLTGQRQPVNPRDILKLFSSRLMWVCGVIQYTRCAVMLGVAFWLPSLLVDEKGLSLPITGTIIALRAIIIAPMSLIGAYASDRFKKPILIIAVSLFVLMITTALLPIVNGMVLLVTVIAINSIFVQMYFGPLFAVPVEIMGKRTAGTSMGISNLFANIGTLTYTYLLGALRDATGSFLTGFLTVAATCVVGLAFTWILARMRRTALAAGITEVSPGQAPR
jgi:sugar phosphate permease